MQFSIAGLGDPPRSMFEMDFTNTDLVQAETRPAPSFVELREALSAGREAILALYERYRKTELRE